jgi:glycosyltransferase involved in cell wall biosynthesis
MRIAIVHDYLNQFGGAERVVAALHEIWPEAPVYTSIYDRRRMPKIFQKMDIRVSFMQRLPFVLGLFKYYVLVYPLAFESFDLGEYDVILSSSSAWAKGVKKGPDQLHICYCHTPMRFVWRYEEYVKRESIPAFMKSVLPLMLEPVKKWDLQTVAGVDHYIANSRTVAERIQKTYGRQSVIINPPVECGLFQPSALDRDYFLVVSRLNTYKRIDIAVEAFNRLELPLKIIGDGPDRKVLQRMAGSQIEFLGRLPDAEMAEYLADCRALIFPGEEDFGIVPLEAMSAGRPVIAFKAGGAEETVVEDETGVFFDAQTADSLMRALKRFQFESFNKKRIREHALRFDKRVFQEKVRAFVEQKAREWKR